MPDSRPKHPCPPYATFSPFINFANKLRESGIVPSRIDPSVFNNASGSISYSIIAALKSLQFIAANGVPNESFNNFVMASDEDRPAIMREAMKLAYPTLHSGGFPLERATANQFDEHLRENYEARGSTVDKVATFFIHAAEFSGIPVSDLIKNRKPSSTAAKPNGSRKAKKAMPAAPVQDEAPIQKISNSALEYKLVDLMREPDIDDQERQAIWTLVQYLTKKSKKAVDQK